VPFLKIWLTTVMMQRIEFRDTNTRKIRMWYFKLSFKKNRSYELIQDNKILYFQKLGKYLVNHAMTDSPAENRRSYQWKTQRLGWQQQCRYQNTFLNSTHNFAYDASEPTLKLRKNAEILCSTFQTGLRENKLK